MRNCVTVDGIILSREQVEKALMELNKPEPKVELVPFVPPDDVYMFPQSHPMRNVIMINNTASRDGGKDAIKNGLFLSTIYHKFDLTDQGGWMFLKVSKK